MAAKGPNEGQRDGQRKAPWLQLTVQLPATEAVLAEALLSESSAASLTLQDAEDEAVFQTEPGSTPIWQLTKVTGLFEAGADMPDIIQSLEQGLGRDLSSAITIEELEDEDWERVWMDVYQPIQFGSRLWVCPGWLTPPDPDAVTVMLDPGLAFGTGTHPTTALCLEWLEQQELTGGTVIDYGCGSGILGIAAALLGAGRILAVDNDEQAVTACAANRDNNGLRQEQLSVHLPGQPLPVADVLVSNILAGPLGELAPLLAGLVREGGLLALSGILREQAEPLLRIYGRYFSMGPVETREEWVILQGVRIREAGSDQDMANDL